MSRQPIETAPKNGQRIDLFNSLGRRAPDCYWHKHAQRWISKWHTKDGYSALREPFVPTCWMPIPAAQPALHDRQDDAGGGEL